VDVSVIIVSYNSTSVLRPCLESLANHRFSGEMEVIVVDNASTDGTPDMLRREYPGVELVESKENLGYSKGVNVGIRRARGRYFFILNPDTAVSADAVEKLRDFMERTPDAGIVGPKLVFHDGNVQLSCRRFYTLRVLLLRRTPLGKLVRDSRAEREHLMLDFDHNSTRQVDWLLGAAMFVRRDAVESVGMMDERFFLYFEDVDWCYRMVQQGLKVYYQADAVVTHGYQRDSAQGVMNRSFVSHFVSLLRYYEKWNFVVYFMKRYREIVKFLLFFLLDVVAFNAAFVSAYYLRITLGDLFPNPLFPVSEYDRFVIFENLLFVFTFAAMGLYRVRRETRGGDELFSITKAVVLASVLLMTSTYLGQIRTYSRLVVAFVVPFAIAYDWALRSGIRSLHRRLLTLKVDLKRICVVGPYRQANEIELRLTQDDKLGADVVGIVDTASESDAILTGTLGRVEDLERIVEKHRVQEVIVIDGSVSDERLAEIVGMGRRRVLDVTVLTDYAGLVFQKARVSQLQGRPVISFPRNTMYALSRGVKRVFDVVFGGIFVVVSLPFYVIYSLYALSRSAKPFTYIERLGLEEEPFTIPLAGSEKSRGPSDFVNLPLFWLVVIGKMSFVGPYALAAPDAARLGRAARFRFETRPGVTGNWRMQKLAAGSADDMLAQDMGYVQSWSLIEDLKIFLVTLPQLVFGRNRILSLDNRVVPTVSSKGEQE